MNERRLRVIELISLAMLLVSLAGIVLMVVLAVRYSVQ